MLVTVYVDPFNCKLSLSDCARTNSRKEEVAAGKHSQVNTDAKQRLPYYIISPVRTPVILHFLYADSSWCGLARSFFEHENLCWDRSFPAAAASHRMMEES
jgi:hypothetical protein